MVQHAAVGVLRNMSYRPHSVPNKYAVCEAGGVEVLVRLLRNARSEDQLTCMVNCMGIQGSSSQSNHLSVSSANGPMAGNTQSLPNSHTSNTPAPTPTVPVQPVATDFLPASTSTPHPNVRQENGPMPGVTTGPLPGVTIGSLPGVTISPLRYPLGLSPANVVPPTHFGFKGSTTPSLQVNTSGSVPSLGTDVSASTALTTTSGARQPVAAAVSSTALFQPLSQQVLADL
ncbi:uncharacterized protein LOC135822417 [Sycon ciliatum]|uniref:uncharacterized protein LOC135822417 n=1 Tax=Sycon ciliatum TaxID=27933 RepID=UPI0031F60724